jgi:hypothetical protein
MQRVPAASIKGRAIVELQNMKFAVAAGALANADISLPLIKTGDSILGCINLTDSTDFDLAAVAASKDTFGASLDTIVVATTAGDEGNDLSVALLGDSALAAGVTIVRNGDAFIIHYESGVSTVSDVETAIAALAGGNDLIGVGTPGTGATVLTAPASNCPATFLAGGSNAGLNLPAVNADGTIRMSVDTTGKTLLVIYVPSL